MAKVKKVAATVVRRAKATAGLVGKKGMALATQLAEGVTELASKKNVKKAKKTVARARTQASNLASKITGRPKRKSRTKVAVAAAGAAVVAAAAGLSLARRQKR